MTRLRSLLLLAGPVVLFIIPSILFFDRPPVSAAPVDAFFDDATGLVLIAAGIVAGQRRPRSRVGWLLVIAGYLWYVGSLYEVIPWTSPLIYVPFVLRGLYEPILAYVILTFPGDRLETRGDRGAFGALLGVVVMRAAWRAVGLGPATGVPPEAPGNPLRLVADAGTFVTVDQALTFALGIALLGVAAMAIRRRGRIPAGARRAVDPVLLGGAAYAIGAAPYLMAVFLHPQLHIDIVPWEGPGWTLQYVLRTLAPIGFLVGSLRLRRGTDAVVQLIAGPGGPPRGPALETSLRRALDDPTLELAYPGPGGAWVDRDGSPVGWPEPDGARAATLIEADGTPSAAIIHDATLLGDPSLLPTVAAAVGLAVENERLQADVRAQLEETRASRARIVEAADAERRRVERDLHDGAQQRLVGLAVSLRMIRARLGPDIDEAIAADLEAASGDVKAAIDELRELARGLDPAILREAGLGPALRSLAGRSPVPVRLDVDVPERLPSSVETAAYFVVSEALANVAKHAAASSVTVSAHRVDGRLCLEIVDDGAGGADPSGDGLRGLADRIAAQDGEFHVVSVPGSGTTVQAVIPCGS